ncbi:MAG: hypothetical protein RLZZ156_2889 [Deinococcota bacterium]|jgi:uncharacterized protein
MRVVLDSNVFIAALLAPKGVAALLLGLWRQQRFTLLYSSELMLELREVLSRPVFVKRIKRYRIGALIKRIQFRGERIRNNRNSVYSKDPKDDFLIAIAENGQADYLVSRDTQGILILNLEFCKVITPEALLKLFDRKRIQN